MDCYFPARWNPLFDRIGLLGVAASLEQEGKASPTWRRSTRCAATGAASTGKKGSAQGKRGQALTSRLSSLSIDDRAALRLHHNLLDGDAGEAEAFADVTAPHLLRTERPWPGKRRVKLLHGQGKIQ
jgi:hypothetical protein